ncbi:MAG: hypothetical protein LWX11_03535 [Firmicutes bacterium]|nr:hypothetical protein [Bacillota bacterium]
MEALFEERGLPLDLPELEPFKADFEHLHADERVRWADAVAELHRRQWPFPPAWIDAQFEVILEVVPTWRAEREQRFYRPAFDGLSKRVRVKNEVMPEAWLALWDVSANDVMDRALDHLEANSKHKPFVRMASGVYASAFGDGLDAARLLLPDLWCNLFPGQNTFVAAPCENRLLVAPQVLLPKLVEAIGQCLSAPTGPRVQAVILQYVNQKLLPANLQDPHPIAQPQRDLRQNDLMEAYRAQEEDLDAALGQPTPLSLLRTNQGRSLSMALWVEGSPVLLPECDTIGFVAKSGQPLGVYFRQTLPRIPELKGTPVDIWGPRRQRYEGFPTREQLNRLESFASPEQMAQIFKGNNASAPQAPRPTAPSFAQSTSAMLGNSSPVPAHLRGQSLGMQNAEQES